jgi:UDP-glucose 4-epimerase
MPNKKTVIIAGGAGYIGSCTAYLLQAAGYEPIIFDNFSTSKKTTTQNFSTFEIDLTDLKALSALMSKIPKVHAIFHFAAKALVPESTERLWDYFHNNLNATLNLCETAERFSISNFIHSSTCAVYGMPKTLPMKENDTLNPVTPYGHSKLAAENILEQYSVWKKLRVINLRYFNPAGAIPEAGLGEAHDPETHLVPNLVKSFIYQLEFKIYGNDYPTPDGTCIRDLIHIRDLAQAHLLALEALETSTDIRFENINVGTGRGVSIKEVIEITERELGKNLQTRFEPRRSGDPAQLIADSSKMKKLFKWSPKLSIEAMVRDHLKFVLGENR